MYVSTDICVLVKIVASLSSGAAGEFLTFFITDVRDFYRVETILGLVRKQAGTTYADTNLEFQLALGVGIQNRFHIVLSCHFFG